MTVTSLAAVKVVAEALLQAPLFGEITQVDLQAHPVIRAKGVSGASRDSFSDPGRKLTVGRVPARAESSTKGNGCRYVKAVVKAGGANKKLSGLLEGCCADGSLTPWARNIGAHSWTLSADFVLKVRAILRNTVQGFWFGVWFSRPEQCGLG